MRKSRLITAAALPLLAAAALGLSNSHARADQPQLYVTSYQGAIQLATSATVYRYYADSHPDVTKTVVFSQRVDDIRAGDILKVNAEISAKSIWQRPVMIATQLYLSKDPRGNNKTADTKTLNNDNAYNVTPGMVHAPKTDVADYVATSADAGTRYVTLCLWAAGSAYYPAQLPDGAQVDIEANTGHLGVVKLSKR